MRRALVPAALALGLVIAPAQASGSAEIEIVLDCSGSMTEPLEGRTKFAIAKESFQALVDGVPDGTRVGLRAYGHRLPTTNRPASCQDIELLFPIGPIDKVAMKRRVQELACRGLTPIAASIQQAAADFSAGDVKRTIIVLTDGIETCGGDPADVTRRLRASGLDLTVHVVGFGIAANDRASLEGIAVAGGGRYYHASGATELLSGLQDALQQALPEFAATKLFWRTGWYEACEVEVVEDKGDLLRVKVPGGQLMDAPEYLCFEPGQVDPASLRVGAEVMVATLVDRDSGRPLRVHAATILESKDDALRVTLQGSDRQMMSSPRQLLALPPPLVEGQAVPLSVHKSYPCEREHPATNLVQPGLDATEAHSSRLTVPLGITLRLGAAQEVRRLGLLGAAFNTDDRSPGALELWAGGPGEGGFVWTPLGRIEPPSGRSWLFLRFPPMTAEYLHVRVSRLGATGTVGYLHLSRIRAYSDDGPGSLPLEPIADPRPPVGEAGELERRAQQVLVAEGEKYREVRLLRRTGDQVIAITNAGARVTVAAAMAIPPEPVELARLELGDDVLVNEGAFTGSGANDLWIRAMVTGTTSERVEVQVGARQVSFAAKDLYRAPPP